MDPNTKSFMDAINNQVIYFMGACVGVGIAMMIRALRYTPDSRQQKRIEAHGKLLARLAADSQTPITIVTASNSVMIYFTGDLARIQQMVSAVEAVAHSWEQKTTEVGQ